MFYPDSIGARQVSDWIESLNKEHGRLIFTFHHWDPEAWAELALSLKRAGFVLMSRWVVFSESPASVHIRDLQALKHDVILVLKPEIGEGEAPRWPKPAQIDATDSYTFCRDCGAALGWFLSTELSEVQIRDQWRDLANLNVPPKQVEARIGLALDGARVS